MFYFSVVIEMYPKKFDPLTERSCEFLVIHKPYSTPIDLPMRCPMNHSAKSKSSRILHSNKTMRL